jgi:hypothetical protein
MCSLTPPATHCLVEGPSLGIIIPYSCMADGAADGLHRYLLMYCRANC